MSEESGEFDEQVKKYNRILQELDEERCEDV